MFSGLRIRLRALFRRGAVERELNEELRFHLERAIEKHMRAGMTPMDAARRARSEFGAVEWIREEARDARGVTRIEWLMQDVRYGWRGLRSEPGFTTAVVSLLALGLGVNIAMFGIVDRMLLRPPAHLRAPERVHRVYLSYDSNGRRVIEHDLAYARYVDLSEFARSFEAAAAFDHRTLAVGLGERAREVTVASVSASLFGFFDVEPALGRFFTAAEDRLPAGEPVVVLGYDFWRSEFGGSRVVPGQALHIGDGAYTIIGVAPRGFGGIPDGEAPAAFIPITSLAHSVSADYADHYGWTWLEMVVRRRAGATTTAAGMDLNAAYARSWEIERQGAPWLEAAAVARARADLGSVLLSRGLQAGSDARVAAWVMGVAVVVLLIACANVINLLLARAVSRSRAVALRLALGITRARLVQQLLVEALLLVVPGVLIGLVIAQWGGHVLQAFFLPAVDLGTVTTDLRTLVFAAGITVGLVLPTAAAPVVRVLRADLAALLKAGMRESTYRQSRLRTGLLLFQAALSVVLLVGAGLFVRSLLNVRSLRLGYDVQPIVQVDGNLRGTRLGPAEANALAARLLAAARRTPGVRNATLTISVPFRFGEGRGAPFVPGRDSVARLGRFRLQAGSAEYFETMGTRILRGRGFMTYDGPGTLPIVVVNQAMAAALWPGQDPIGKQMRIGSDTQPFLTVVGVAEDMRGAQLGGDPEFWYYLPIHQYAARFGSARPNLFVRIEGDEDAVMQRLRQELQAEMPGAGYVKVRPLRLLVEAQQRSWHFGATLFVAFATLALILAAMGLYSVVASDVAQRTRELGVRIALGADVGSILRLVVGQGVAFTVAGVVLGGAAAMLAARWVEPLLFATSARDPLVYSAVSLLLIVVSCAATVRPVVRAIRVDPIVALGAD